MEKIKQCAANRYCRLYTVLKIAIVIIAVTVISIALMYERVAHEEHQVTAVE